MAGTRYYATIADKAESTTEASLGSSNTAAMKSAFPSSPLYTEKALLNDEIVEYNEETLPELFEALALNGEVQNGNGFSGGFNRDFSQGTQDSEKAPDIPNVKQDKEGNDLYSPYVPNPTSPGAGNGFDHTKKPMHNVAPPSPSDVANKQFGSGFSSLFNPAEISQLIESIGIVKAVGSSIDKP